MALALNAARVPILMSSQWNLPLHPGLVEPTFYQIFQKGQPRALGTLQISMAFIQIVLGMILIFSSNYSYENVTLNSGIPFWGPVLYIISGSLSISAGNTQSSCLIRGCLALNIISTTASALELAFLIADMSSITAYCGAQTSCTGEQNMTWIIRLVVLISLTIASLLQFCVSTSVSSFGCRSLSYNSVITPQHALLMSNDYLARIAQPVYPYSTLHSPGPVTVTSQYPALPTNYENQKNTGITLQNPTMLPQVVLP